jgi:predicted secreted protein
MCAHGQVSFAGPMNRRLARKNIRTGLIVAAVCMFMFGITFVVAAAYVS